ncbi:MAG TPA: tRNA (adenosine(37)-N6)-threonylcarbamoyltransferase complex dimerization subunit type 1 TsaB [Coxiellaceae bacterium]|nr:tRNA (adenosine(37)-N6)-threonylcarbamoyltransferase complex dimerization subunit type 1 TsaB [Coxiellaceae bacterium]
MILTFDTATHACSAALDTGERQFSQFEIAPRQHAQLLLPMIKKLFDDAGVQLKQLKVIGFGMGPGSFMGVRLATATAQGLAFGLQIPVIPISTLQTVAQTAYEKTGAKKVAAGWDARMNEIYWGVYAVDDKNLMQPVIEDQLSQPTLIDVPADAVLVGNAWSVYRDQLSRETRALSREENIYPEAKIMLSITREKYNNGKVVSPDVVRPHYIREKVAQPNL